MNKLTFYKHWLANQGYAEKAAVQSIISIQFEDEDSSGQFKNIPYAVWVEDGMYYTNIDGGKVSIEGDVERPLFEMDDFYEFPADFHPVLQGKAVGSTFGLMLFNIILFWEVFGAKVQYVNQDFTKDLIQGLLKDLMVDNPEEGQEVPEGKASVDDCMKFTRHCYFLEGLGTYFVKPGGLDTLSLSPTILKRKEELLKQLEADGKVNDPVAFTNMLEELVEMDRKEQLSGPSANFYINDKFISNARKRMFLAFGIEPNPTGDGWVGLTRSLDEGVDPEQLVTYINTAVAGAYSRSMATGEGGAQVKDILKLVGRRRIADIDCNTKLGEIVYMLEQTHKGWIGMYYINEKGVSELITPEVAKANIGKVLTVRSVDLCATAEGNYCQMCSGNGLGKYGNRLSAEVVRVPTESMLRRMKAAHTAGSKTGRMNLATAIK